MTQTLNQFVKSGLKDIKKQMVFAAKTGLNEIAKDVKKGVERQLKSDIDRPTPFTQKGFKINWANKTNLTASVEIKPIQASYLRYQIKGGTRGGSRKNPVFAPGKGQKTNKHGNLPRNKSKNALKRSDTFKATIKGVEGVWQRGNFGKTGKFSTSKKKRNSNVKLLVGFFNKADYKERYDFYGRGYGTARKVYKMHMDAAIKKAFATAR